MRKNGGKTANALRSLENCWLRLQIFPNGNANRRSPQQHRFRDPELQVFCWAVTSLLTTNEGLFLPYLCSAANDHREWSLRSA